MRKILPRGGVWLLLALLLMGYALLSLSRIDPLLQYVAAAPALVQDAEPDAENAGSAADAGRDALTATPNGELLALSAALDEAVLGLSGSVEFAAFNAEVHPVVLSAGARSEQAKLRAVGRRYFELYPALLLDGRLFYPEEYKKDAERVAVIGDALALKLFGTAQAVNRTFMAGGVEFRVVGVLRRGRAVGEQTRLEAYAPLAALAEAKIAFQTVTATAKPVPKAGASVFFASAMAQWRPGGASYDLSKEVLRAQVLPRSVLALLALFGAALWLRRTARRAVARRAEVRAALMREYLRPLLGRIAFTALPVALNFAGALALGAFAIWFLAQPVYAFPEWVPSVLLGWTEIETTFWNLMEGYAAPIAYQTAAVARIRYFSALLHLGTVFALLAALCLALKAKSNATSAQDSAGQALKPRA